MVMERYAKQILFPEVGPDGQAKLHNSRISIIGCGALGTVIANNLARSGVGFIRIIDRDYIELSNLQRQILFDENDIGENLPKAVAAYRRLISINSLITIESKVVDINSRTISKLCSDVDLILDATDNLNTRYIINDFAIKNNIPWVYGGAVGSMGMVYPVLPGQGPCFRCIYPNLPSAGSIDTCDTVGVLNGITNIVASLQSTEAIKILIGAKENISRELRFIDVWNGDYEQIPIQNKIDCPACSKKQFDFLKQDMEDAIYLCGKDSVQVNPINTSISIEQIINRLEKIGIEVKYNSFFMKFAVDNVQFTLFPDGRAILKNVSDTGVAKSLYARYIGI
jgi:molybdopterin-synthase adenylyltransferase